MTTPAAKARTARYLSRHRAAGGKLVSVRMDAEQLARADALRLPGESRSACVNRMLWIMSQPKEAAEQQCRTRVDCGTDSLPQKPISQTTHRSATARGREAMTTTPTPNTVSTSEELLELALDYENGLAAETSAQWRKTALYLREYAALLVIESGRTQGDKP